MRDAFETYHPIINFGFFCAVIIFGMIFLHPIFLSASFLGSLLYALCLKGKKAIKFFVIFPLPMIVIASVINPLFNHRGVTVMFYFRNNPVTKEAMIYGIVSGIMFASIIMWFYCYNEIMSSDKFMYIFGRAIPSMSLIFSMVLRFVPRFTAQIKVISNAQKCVGRDISNGRFIAKTKHGMKIISIMTTWALENAIDTADSMKSRGYGLKGRTAFSNFRFDGRDKIVGGFLSFMIVIIIIGAFSGNNGTVYYPEIILPEEGSATIIIYGAYFALCLCPTILKVKESLKWKHLQSRI